MNIHAKRFDKVRYLDEKFIPIGYDIEIDFADKYLIKGNEYTVSKMLIDDDGTHRVTIIECGDIAFHSALFEDVQKEFISTKMGKSAVNIQSDIDKAILFNMVDSPNFNGTNNAVSNMVNDGRVVIGEDQSPERKRIAIPFKRLSDESYNGKIIDPSIYAMDEIGRYSYRNPMTKPVFTKSKTESDWAENLLIPHQTIDRHSVFDDHFKIIGILDRGVRRTKSLKFNNFDWNQLFNRTVSKHKKFGKEVEYETYHILSYNGDKKFTIIAELKSNKNGK